MHSQPAQSSTVYESHILRHLMCCQPALSSAVPREAYDMEWAHKTHRSTSVLSTGPEQRGVQELYTR